MSFLNIEFAPLNIPLERRLQTLSVLFMTMILGSLWTSPLLFYYLVFHTRLWWIFILYAAWYLTIDKDVPEKGGRRSYWMRNWCCWSLARDYFPIKMVRTSCEELDSKRNYIFCYFPHGIFATGAFITFVTNATGFSKEFPHHTIYIHTISLVYKFPFIRELLMWLGCVPVTEKAINYIQKQTNGGNISAIVPGGVSEMYYCKPGRHKLLLRKRKGFIRMALMNGSPLVPIYGFGETDLYSYLDIVGEKFRNFFKRITGTPILFFNGRGIFQYSFGILPHRRPVTVVVGEPIDVRKTENPTQEQIDNLHQLFEKKLVELFESQKKYYLKDYETAHLEIC